ncbi:tetratricopeptide repeat protein [Fischerella sp. PCC 9605]|uniref:tetratricopeptide repeat protein n=1 Tax=Fischerella sp. PCC 9605 TaxID=1173024 RepID=UPI0004ACCF12|nr:tetratricopeptide repeat protein [Fischerella sp. PCC 9605]
MTDNHVTATLSPADREAILQVIATIREKLPLLANLTTEEFQNLPNLDDRSWAIVSKALDVAQKQDSLPPNNSHKKHQTLQEILKQRQQSNFVGREEEITIFRHNLELPLEDHHRRFIFNVSGRGGVGKSSLLRQFRQIAENAKFITAYTDELEKGVPEVMNHLAQQLEQYGYILAKFSESYKLYQQKLQELEIDPEVPQGFSAFMGRSLFKGDVHLTQQIPGTDIVLEFADQDAGVTQQEWTSYVARKLINKDELRLIQEPIAVLTPLFLEDLWEVAVNSDIALFFDSYDRTEEFLDRWLRDILDGRYGDVPSNILLIVAGRQELDKNHWKVYEESMVRLVLETFTEEETKQFLTRKGISNDEIIDVILRLSEGLPLLVATLAAETPNDDSKVGDANGMVVERFLKWMKDPKWRQVALTAAIPRFLQRDVLAQLRPEEEADMLLDWLQQMPFMKAHPNGWAYHDVAKTLMLRHKRLSSAQSWTQLQGKLADYYESLAQDLQLDEQKKWCDQTWQNYKLNVLYHRLCQAPLKYLPLAFNEFLETLQKHYKFAQSWAETIVQAGKDSDAAEVQRWGEKLLKGLKAWKEQEYEDTAQMFAALIEQGKVDVKWRALAYSFKGATYYKMKRYDEALKSLNQAIKLNPALNCAIELRGHVFAHKKRYSDAVKCFDRLIKLEPDRPRPVAQRGYVYQLMERYDQALADFNRAIELDPNYTWAKTQRGYNYLLMQRYDEVVQDMICILEVEPEQIGALALRGAAYHLLERYGEAIADFNRVLKYEPDNIQVRALRGAAHYLLGHYTEALPDFNHILELEPDHIQAIALRGVIYQLIEHYMEAVQDFDRVLRLDPTYKWAFVQRGETYRQMECYAEAVEDFDCAIALDANDVWTIASRGETYQLMGRNKQALKDFDRALELDPNYARALVKRGEIYQSMKLYEEAIKDFDRALEIDSNCTRVITNRAQTYQLMGHYDQAIKDFDRAIEFEPENLQVITNRAQTYQLMEHYDQAIKDFDRALELDPVNEKAIVSRAETCQLMKDYDQALKDFDRALELDPINDKAIVSRAYTYWMMNCYQQALKEFDRAIEINSNNHKAFAGRGHTYRMMNCYTEALLEFDRAIEINPNDDWAWAGRGDTYCRMKRYTEALKDLNRAIELNSKQHYEWKLAGRGYTHLMLKRYHEAVADINLAIELNTDDDWYLYLRALAYQVLKEQNKARTDLTVAIKIAKKRYEQDTQDWRNTFRVALYYLAVQHYPTVESLYRYALGNGASLEHIREAIHNLDDFLTIFPDHKQAKSMHELLLSGLNRCLTGTPISRKEEISHEREMINQVSTV